MLGPAILFMSSLKNLSRLLFVADYQKHQTPNLWCWRVYFRYYYYKVSKVKTKHAQPWTFAECPTFSVETQKKQTTETETL